MKRKKKIWIPIVVVVAVLLILFVPIPRGTYKDGGTKEYTALTYRVVHWNRLYEDEKYTKTRVYFGGDCFKSIDALWEKEWEQVEHSFIGTVLEIKGNSVLVEPVVGEWERNSSDKISFSTEGMDIDAEVGSVVKITYTGSIRESYPASINAVKWELSKDLRHLEYTGTWIDKEIAIKEEYDSSSDVIITEIYSDCFFANTVIPMPYTYKINGKLSDEWCVGDQVLVAYSNLYRDGEDYKMECDLETIEVSTFEIEPGVCYKPVIYLYPEETTEVLVSLALDGALTCTYPAYDDGWKVTAEPDGTLTDAVGQTYHYLYWEGETFAEWDMSKGFCVKGEDTAKFLEEALDKLGLTRREANEFIVYWLPLMQNNAYNVISFQTEVYTDAAKLDVVPNPDTMLRVFMTYKAADSYVELEAQELIAPERTGFTVVEWGGTEVK